MSVERRRAVVAEPRVTVLDSGVRVVTEAMPTVRSVTLGFWIATGSVRETEIGVRAVASGRAHALPRDRSLRLAGDRPDLRHDGRRAERRHRQGEHVGLRPRDRRSSAAGVRRRRRHGVASTHRRRRSRQRARDRARGDRDVRGRPAGPRLRRARRGGLRRPSARSCGHRPRRRHLGHERRGPAGLPRGALRAGRRRHRGGGIAGPRRGRRSSRDGLDVPQRPAAAAPPPVPRCCRRTCASCQGHRAVPHHARRAGARPRRRAPLRAARARQHPRWDIVVAAVPGDPRAARAGLQRLLVSVAQRGDRADGDLPRHPARQRRPGADRSSPTSSSACARTASPPRSSSDPRRTSRAASSCRSSRPLPA